MFTVKGTDLQIKGETGKPQAVPCSVPFTPPTPVFKLAQALLHQTRPASGPLPHAWLHFPDILIRGPSAQALEKSSCITNADLWSWESAGVPTLKGDLELGAGARTMSLHLGKLGSAAWS